jgi:hypothetical protein
MLPALRVLRPALLIGSQIVSANGLHAMCYMVARELGLIPKSDDDKEGWRTLYLETGCEEGFEMSDGSFANREDAAAIALANGQATEAYRPQELHACDFDQS